jgi:methylthioribose-1-phosphate isomerase
VQDGTMKVDGRAFRTIWREWQSGNVAIIDQTKLPHAFVIAELRGVDDAWHAIADMHVRGAPLIGVAAAYGLVLALRADASDANLAAAANYLATARPTAINLAWALNDMRRVLAPLPPSQRPERAFARAGELADADVAVNDSIGTHGLATFRELASLKNGRLNILTHCNAGWLATVDWGTATAPIYKGHESGLDLHVFVDETRPRNQGAALTAWELAHHGVPHTLIADNAGGHLMQQGKVDLVIVGTDRTTASGDVCNKIGTYLKALAAHDNGVPFYVAAPSSSIDFGTYAGTDVPIEMRGEEEVTHMTGATADGRIETVRIAPEGSPALNPAFDVTPARLVTGLITERGIIAANADALARAFPERVKAAA